MMSKEFHYRRDEVSGALAVWGVTQPPRSVSAKTKAKRRKKNKAAGKARRNNQK